MEEKKNFKESVKDTAQKVGDWFQRTGTRIKYYYIDHKEEVIVVGSTILVAAGGLVKTVAKQRKIQKEEDLKDRYIYDRSGGHYWKLRRKPTNSEWAAIESRRRSGEKYADILSSMRLL